MRFIYLITSLVLGSFLLTSCDKKETDYLTPMVYEGVDKEFWAFFHKFEKEAEDRGVIIDLRALEIAGSLERINANHIVGLCNSGHSEKHIILDMDFWSRASDYEKEAIIFHELGHCVLERGHSDGNLDNGMCKSLMRSGFSDCITIYRKEKNRSYYLDELFLF